MRTGLLRLLALAVWGRARYLSVTDVPHNIESLRVSGEETICFFITWMQEWGLNPRSPSFQAGSFNTAPGQDDWQDDWLTDWLTELLSGWLNGWQTGLITG